MKFLTLLTLVFSFTSIGLSKAQTLGAKKNVVLKITGYGCGGDYCSLELKDIANGETYTLDNTDEKTIDKGILKSIQDLYYKNGESDEKLIGKKYNAILEYRKTDIWENISTDEPPRKTGKKKTIWMINSLSVFSK
jgi:hypothetical protein